MTPPLSFSLLAVFVVSSSSCDMKGEGLVPFELTKSCSGNGIIITNTGIVIGVLSASLPVSSSVSLASLSSLSPFGSVLLLLTGTETTSSV